MARKKITIGAGDISLSYDEGVMWFLDPREISSSLRRANRSALEEVGDRIISDTEPYVPKQREPYGGALRSSALAEISGSSSDNASMNISYYRTALNKATGHTLEISHLLYKGINPATGRKVQNWSTEGTGPEWLKVSLENHGEEWLNEFDADFKNSFVKHR